MPTVEQLRGRLIAKLEELFQLNQPDLDFGFYRIMHAKSDQVRRFLNDDLRVLVQREFGEHGTAAAEEKLAEVRQRVDEALGSGAIDGDGNLAEAFAETPAGREYLAALLASRQAADTSKIEAAKIYFANHCPITIQIGIISIRSGPIT